MLITPDTAVPCSPLLDLSNAGGPSPPRSILHPHDCMLPGGLAIDSGTTSHSPEPERAATATLPSNIGRDGIAPNENNQTRRTKKLLA
jgi:hypothetical protein